MASIRTKEKSGTQPPPIQYFNELFRVSKNQIIWGANYFTPKLPASMGWIFWDKQNGASDFSDGELAFTSFDRALRICKQHLSKDRSERFHPTQKPIYLYRFCLENYAKPNDKILDTHLGSGSIAIACHDYGYDLTACELDKDYFDKAMTRISNHTAQGNLFT